ncbi:MAG TPA: ATP-dependent DNA helicase, partial [Acidimicrobiales bacterium]|nr:ATP-dependent DNA helicase [Acidimicrobiales bacterium]
EVGPILAERLWPRVTAVLTSATVPPATEARLGLPAATTDRVDVGSPFPFRERAVLYCPKHLPDRRSAGAEAAIWDEIEGLVLAAGGRTLALFTSWRAMRAGVEALTPRLPFRILAQNDLPKPKLVDEFRREESACLFATMSFWQGVDVPGRTLSLVILDRLPFPRPDDPLLQARRDRAGPGAFAAVDLPRAATLLAQGAGRLIRKTDDAGVVAVLDPRLATASYRRTLLDGFPPMRRSIDGDQTRQFLREIAAGGEPLMHDARSDASEPDPSP